MHARSIVFSMYELLVIVNKCFSEVTPGSLCWILLCIRHIYSLKNTGNTQEAVDPSRHDCKIIDWGVKHQHKQTNGIYMLGESRDPTLTICLDNRKLAYQRLFLSASVTKINEVSKTKIVEHFDLLHKVLFYGIPASKYTQSNCFDMHARSIEVCTE